MKQPRKSTKKPAPKSTAIARRPPARVAAVRRPTVVASAPTEIAPGRVLTDDVNLGLLGTVEVKLSAQENAVLNQPVNVADVRIKPSGQPYLPHGAYTRWFNEAFGRLGWAIVPASVPRKLADVDGSVSGVARDFVLFIHGQPAAHAMGEQDYSGKNKEQTWGDALEACVASALRRMAKRLGVGLELWDREFIDQYIADQCVHVQVKTRGEIVRRWRRRVDPRLPGEIGIAKDGDDAQPTQRAQAPMYDADAQARRSTEVITPAQANRLSVCVMNSGRNPNIVREWLIKRYGFATYGAVTKGTYDAIVREIEGDGKL